MRTQKYPKLLVFRKKHCDSYYVIGSQEGLMQMFVSEIEEEKENHSWMKDYKSRTERPAYTLEEIQALPESMEKEKKEMQKKLSDWEVAERRAAEHRETWKMIEELTVNTDLKKARLVAQMMELDYEELSFEGLGFPEQS